MNDIRTNILGRTPYYIDYDVAPAARMRPPIDADELARLFAGYAVTLPMDRDEFRVAAYGAWDELLPQSIALDKAFITDYERALVDARTALDPIVPERFSEAIAAVEHGFHNRTVRTSDEGWVMAALQGAYSLDPQIIIRAIAPDPSGIALRWSLTAFVDDDTRLGIIRRTFDGPPERWIAGVVHLQYMLDRRAGADADIPEIARVALESTPTNAAPFVLGSLLAHYFIWTRNTTQPHMQHFFAARASLLEEYIQRHVFDEGRIHDAMEAADKTEASAAAFIYQAASNESTRDAAARIGVGLFESAFRLVDDEEYIGVGAFDTLNAYTQSAVQMPLSASRFRGLLENLQCDEMGLILSPAAYWRDRHRAIVLCAIAASVARAVTDEELLREVQRAAAMLSLLPPGNQRGIEASFVDAVRSDTGISLPTN